jgi:hypothetical protein
MFFEKSIFWLMGFGLSGFLVWLFVLMDHDDAYEDGFLH